MTEAQFWRLSPRGLDLLYRRKLEEEKRLQGIAGTMLSWLTAPNLKQPKTPADFFPLLSPKKTRTAPAAIADPQQILALFQALAARTQGPDAREAG